MYSKETYEQVGERIRLGCVRDVAISYPSGNSIFPAKELLCMSADCNSEEKERLPPYCPLRIKFELLASHEFACIEWHSAK